MTAATKTPLEHVNAVLAQLKEMHHYAKNNVETLTAQWLLFDGELKQLRQTEQIESLLTRQSELHDALQAEIAVLEELAIKLQPVTEEDAAPPPTPARRLGSAEEILRCHARPPPESRLSESRL